MKKYLICDAVRADSGKTETLLKVIEKLGGDKVAKMIDVKDKYAIIDVDGEKVGVVTLGDPGCGLGDYLQEIADESAKIIVAASRTRGCTVDDVVRVANKNGYEVIWFNNFYFNGHSDEESRSLLNSLSADAVVSTVHALLSMN